MGRRMTIRKIKSGMTMVELLVALAIGVIATIAILQGYLGNIFMSEIAKGNTVAMDDLVDMLERIKCTPFNELTAKFPNGTVNGPAANLYTNITGNYTLKGEQIVVTYTNVTSDPLEIMVTVNWQDQIGRQYGNSLTTKKTR
ncbi:MAG: prepilin-type N-terminal cleavage/methylation domain-containing protein [Candidatus Omnitrophota bacterium]|nr:MAG: prepilin-type N-terminal cleavage/methylation domain-containing protein [Candidatus Omnitrophota bacterium]